MAKKEKKLTTRELIKKTLNYISEEAYKPWNNVSFIDVRIHWIKTGVPDGYWRPTQQILVHNKLVRVGYGTPYNLELTAWAYSFLTEQVDPFALKNPDNEHKAFEFSPEIKEYNTIDLCHQNWLAIGWFLFVRWLRAKIGGNAWWQLIITGLAVGLILLIVGEFIKHWLSPSNC